MLNISISSIGVHNTSVCRHSSVGIKLFPFLLFQELACDSFYSVLRLHSKFANYLGVGCDDNAVIIFVLFFSLLTL